MEDHNILKSSAALKIINELMSSEEGTLMGGVLPGATPKKIIDVLELESNGLNNQKNINTLNSMSKKSLNKLYEELCNKDKTLGSLLLTKLTSEKVSQILRIIRSRQEGVELFQDFMENSPEKAAEVLFFTIPDGIKEGHKEQLLSNITTGNIASIFNTALGYNLPYKLKSLFDLLDANQKIELLLYENLGDKLIENLDTTRLKEVLIERQDLDPKIIATILDNNNITINQAADILYEQLKADKGNGQDRKTAKIIVEMKNKGNNLLLFDLAKGTKITLYTLVTEMSRINPANTAKILSTHLDNKKIRDYVVRVLGKKNVDPHKIFEFMDCETVVDILESTHEDKSKLKDPTHVINEIESRDKQLEIGNEIIIRKLNKALSEAREIKVDKQNKDKKDVIEYNELILGLKERKEKIELQQSEIDKRKKVRALGAPRVVQELKDRHNEEYPPNDLTCEFSRVQKAQKRLKEKIKYINEINLDTELNEVHEGIEVIEDLVLRSKANKKYLIEEGIVNENLTSGTSFPFTQKSEILGKLFNQKFGEETEEKEQEMKELGQQLKKLEQEGRFTFGKKEQQVEEKNEKYKDEVRFIFGEDDDMFGEKTEEQWRDMLNDRNMMLRGDERLTAESKEEERKDSELSDMERIKNATSIRNDKQRQSLSRGLGKY